MCETGVNGKSEKFSCKKSTWVLMHEFCGIYFNVRIFSYITSLLCLGNWGCQINDCQLEIIMLEFAIMKSEGKLTVEKLIHLYSDQDIFCVLKKKNSYLHLPLLYSHCHIHEWQRTYRSSQLQEVWGQQPVFNSEVEQVVTPTHTWLCVVWGVQRKFLFPKYVSYRRAASLLKLFLA